MGDTTFTVSELNRYLKHIIENDIKLKNIYVRGEISNFKLHSSGHMYFTLKDEDSRIKCIMFKSYGSLLRFMPEDGMNVILRGYVSVYERDGQYQLYCYKMEPDGIGSLYLAFEQLKMRLEREGLFDKALKKPIPMLPRKVGVATSPTGAVIRDIINVATRRFPNINILLYPVKVQGEGASASVVDAVNYFNTRNDIDVIIIGRGGGSIEELWAFNDENLARAIRNSGIPVISAVGHETDFTIADFAADLRASTPSHAAEMAVPVYDEIKYRVRNLEDNLIMDLSNNIENSRYRVRNLIHIVERYSPVNVMAQRIQYIDNLQNKIIYSMNKALSDNKNKFRLLLNRIDDLSPIRVMARGYGYVEKEEAVISTIKDIEPDEMIRIHMHDGIADCKVINVMEGQIWQQRKKN